ncbi:MAG: hypothetical protein RL033_1714 [Pseudomonadota bacterium]|jgi:hypothetical protein
MSERIQALIREVHQSVNEAEHRPALGDRFARMSGAALATVQRELMEEIAHSLGKAGRKVQRQAELLQALVARVASEVLTTDEREQLREEYRRQRALADRHLRDFLIQREALGFRRHDEVRRVYPIPEWPA